MVKQTMDRTVRYDVVHRRADGTEDIWYVYSKDVAEECLTEWRTDHPQDQFELREGV